MIKLIYIKRLKIFLLCCFFLGCSTTDIARDPVFQETEVRNSRPKLSNEMFDEKESNEKYTDIFRNADIIAERKVGNLKRNKKFILSFWKYKKKILREKFGLDWKSPSELNPNICYETYGQPCITPIEKSELTKKVKNNSRSKNESIEGFHRDFHGSVSVISYDPTFDITREYTLSGIEKEWKLLTVYEIEY